MHTGLSIFLMIFCLMMVADVIWWWRADVRLRRMPRASLWRVLLGLWMTWMLGYVLLVCLVPSLIRRSESPVPTGMHAAVYLWHILVLPITGIVFLLVRAPIAFFARIHDWIRGPRTPDRSIEPQVSAAGNRSSPTRREFLAATAIAIPPAITAGLVLAAERQLDEFPRVRRIVLPLRQLPPELDGMTIAHVTDLHIGKFTRARMLPDLAEQVNALRADFIAVTGDLIDMSLSDLPSAIEFLDHLKPRHRLIVCEGNHDLMDSVEGFESMMRSSGHPLLVDEELVMSFRGVPIQFLGIRWDHGSLGIEPSMRRVLAMRRPDTFPILLAHHPHAFDPAALNGIPLTLAGHTHGGQLMLTKNIGAGPLMFRYWSGLYQKDDCALVVSNGIGAWFPLRINAPAEIIHLTLQTQPA